MQITGRLAKGNPKDIDRPRLSERHHKVSRIWAVVADDHVAKIFRKNGRRLECLGLVMPAKTSATPTNKSVGRVISGARGTIHHKYEPRVTQRYQQNISFTRDLAQWLEKTYDDGAFDKLIIAAAPRMLGNLRKASTSNLRTAIISEINKDLTGHPEDALRKELLETASL